MDLGQLSLLWAAGGRRVRCSGLGVAVFMDACGKDMSACKPEDLERGQELYDHLGAAALKARGPRKK